MKINVFRHLALLVGLALTVVACGGGDDGSNSTIRAPSPPTSPPPPPPPPPTTSNVNIDNPALTIADNNEVSPGDMLSLVWSDEFSTSQIDPEVWFFETGDGSQYGIPGWGNNELQYYLPDNASLVNGLLVIEARSEPNKGPSSGGSKASL